MIEQSVSYNQLQKRARELRNRFKRAAFTDFDLLAEAMDKEIESYIQKMPEDASPVHTIGPTLETMGDVLDYVAENIEREVEANEIKARTRKDWEALERQYVTRADYTLADLVDDILTDIERCHNIKIDGAAQVVEAGTFKVLSIDQALVDEAESQLKRYRPCAHRFCLNYFIPRRNDQIYCDESCKQAEKDARKEFKRTSNSDEYSTGTYLPKRAYKTIRSEYSEEKYEKWEIAFDLEGREEIINRSFEEDDERPSEKAINRRKRKESRDRIKTIEQEAESASKKSGPIKQYTLDGEELEIYRRMPRSFEAIEPFINRPNAQYVRGEHWLNESCKVSLIQTNDFENMRRVYCVQVMEGAKVLHEKEFFTRKEADAHYEALKQGEIFTYFTERAF